MSTQNKFPSHLYTSKWSLYIYMVGFRLGVEITTSYRSKFSNSQSYYSVSVRWSCSGCGWRLGTSGHVYGKGRGTPGITVTKSHWLYTHCRTRVSFSLEVIPTIHLVS